MTKSQQRSIGGVSKIALAGIFLLGTPAIADAHVVTTGLGPVCDGIAHLLLTPQDLVAVLGLCLLAGLQGKRHSRTVLFLLPLLWFATGAISGIHTGSYSGSLAPLPFAAISMIVVGLLIAADVRIDLRAIGLLCIAIAVFHGHENGIALSNNAGSMGMLGVMAAIFALVAILTAIVVSMERRWTRIAIRVLGGWLVAIGIMTAGWHYRESGTSAKSIENAAVAMPVEAAHDFQSS